MNMNTTNTTVDRIKLSVTLRTAQDPEPVPASSAVLMCPPNLTYVVCAFVSLEHPAPDSFDGVWVHWPCGRTQELSHPNNVWPLSMVYLSSGTLSEALDFMDLSDPDTQAVVTRVMSRASSHEISRLSAGNAAELRELGFSELLDAHHAL